MIEVLDKLDKQLFLFLNSHYTPLTDFLAWWASNRFIWVPLYLFLGYLLWKRFGKQVWIMLIFVALLILITDQTCNFFKSYVSRWRPTRAPDLEGMVHYINGYRGGRFGFFSGHSANAFALVTFFAFLKLRYKLLVPLLFLWASIVAYSRICLGVHYPGDILCGGLVGAFYGFFMVSLYNYVTAYVNLVKIPRKRAGELLIY